MSYATVAEADAVLGHVAAWMALTDDVKKRHLDTGMLWLNVSYDWPGKISACPIAGEGATTGFPYSFPFTLSGDELAPMITPLWPRVGAGGGELLDCNGCLIKGIPLAVKRAEIVAASKNLNVPLFPEPATASEATQGTLISRKKKVDVLEIEEKWASTSGAEASSRGSLGQLIISETDALLHCIAKRSGTQAPCPVLFCI